MPVHATLPTAVIRHLLAPWRTGPSTRAAVRRLATRLTRLETRMSAFDDRLAEAAALVGRIRAEVQSLRDQLTAEQTDDQAQVDAAVAEARQADADRVGSLVDLLAEILPADVPDVPVPEPGQPATDPTTGETSDEVLAAQPDSGAAPEPGEA